jgi:hypothetical protein
LIAQRTLPLSIPIDPKQLQEEMECDALYVVATRYEYTSPPTGYVLTIYNFPTTLTIETRQLCPGCNQVPYAQLLGGEQPRSDGWTIHTGQGVIKRARCANISRIHR